MWLQALLFDLDGTLADTEADGHRPAYNTAFRELGLTWRWGPKLYRKLLSMPGGRERVRHYVDAYRPGEAGEDVEQLVDTVHSVKSHHYARRLRSGKVSLRPGVRRLIDEAADRGVHVGIVTNASEASVRPFLEHTMGERLVGRIDVVVGSGAGVAKKPAPDLYQLALQRLNTTAEHSVAIEDSDIGLQAARAAGLVTVVTVNGNTRAQCFDDAALVVDSLGEVDDPSHALTPDTHAPPLIDVAMLDRLIDPGARAG